MPGKARIPRVNSPVESNAKILNVQKQLDVKDAHSAVYTVKYSKLILTYAGKIREAEVKIDFNPACEEAKFVRGVVTSKTGERQEISTNEINVMDAGWNASAKRYTGGKILVANLPGVDIGSTIEVEYEDHHPKASRSSRGLSRSNCRMKWRRRSFALIGAGFRSKSRTRSAAKQA